MPDDKTVYYFVGIDGARFKRPVEPGDQLMLRRRRSSAARPASQVQGARIGRRRARRRGRADVHDAPRRADAMADASTHRDRRAGRAAGDERHVGPTASSASTCGSARAPRSGALRDRGPHTTIGRDNEIFQFCSLGAQPQDQK
jgi:hypothetical protein